MISESIDINEIVKSCEIINKNLVGTLGEINVN